MVYITSIDEPDEPERGVEGLDPVSVFDEPDEPERGRGLDPAHGGRIFFSLVRLLRLNDDEARRKNDAPANLVESPILSEDNARRKATKKDAPGSQHSVVLGARHRVSNIVIKGLEGDTSTSSAAGAGTAQKSINEGGAAHDQIPCVINFLIKELEGDANAISATDAETAKTLYNIVHPEPLEDASVPELLDNSQNELALMLSSSALEQKLDIARKELGDALYQHDAVCRDVARIKKERDECRMLLAQADSQIPISVAGPPHELVTNKKRGLEGAAGPDGKRICPVMGQSKKDSCSKFVQKDELSMAVSADKVLIGEAIDNSQLSLHKCTAGLAAFVSSFEKQIMKLEHKSAPKELWRKELKSTWTVQQIIVFLSEIGCVRVRRKASLLDLSDDLARLVMQNLSENSLSIATSSARIFSRAAFLPCHCQAVEEGRSWLVGAIAEQTHQHKLEVMRPLLRYDRPLLTAAGAFLEKYITFCSKNRQWIKVVATRSGIIAVSVEPMAWSFAIWQPFSQLARYTLPQSPWTASSTISDLVTAAILPLPRGSFDLVMLFRADSSLAVMKHFSSITRVWQVHHIRSPFPLSTSQVMEIPVYSCGSLFLLDREHRSVLTIKLEQYIACSINLPSIPCVKSNQVLAKNGRGKPCWVVLDFKSIRTFELEAGIWTEKRSFPLPEHYYTCSSMGQSEDTAHVILICHGLACYLSIDDGSVVTLTDLPPIHSCFCVAVTHPCCDHFQGS
ncbi:hypothetical protein ACQ4PT_008163 [Festuca glaucescens]